MFQEKKKLIIILDLDNTLISSEYATPTSFSDFIITIKEDGKNVDICVNKRPKLGMFLANLSKIAKLILFTAANEEYTKEILREIDPLNLYFEEVFTRDDCILQTDGKYIKDYNKCITDFSRTLIIDDIEANIANYKGNGLKIKPFIGQESDNELEKFLLIIQYLNKFSDVRMAL